MQSSISRVLILLACLSASFLVLEPLAAQATFVAEPAPASIELSFQHQRSGTCPMPVLQGPRNAAAFADPANPSKISVDLSQFFQGGTRFSCPVLRMSNAMVSLEHPSGGFSGTIADVATAPTAVALTTPGLLARAAASGLARDTEGGDRHGFVAAAAANVNPAIVNRPPQDAGCLASDGFSTSSPSSQQLSASVDCALTDLRVVAGSVQMSGDAVTQFQAELVSDAWVKADHGTGTLGNIQRGARYRVTLRTVYQFNLAADAIRFSMLDPDPADPLEAGSAQTFRPTVEYELATKDKAKIILRAMSDEVPPNPTPIATVESPEVMRSASGPQQIQMDFTGVVIPANDVLLIADLVDPAGMVLASTPPARYSLGVDLTIDHIEVVQVVQDENNSIPLVARKATAFRVFTKIAEGPPGKVYKGVPVRFTFLRLGREVESFVIENDRFQTVRAPDRAEITHSTYIYQFGTIDEEGDLEIVAEVNPAGPNGERKIKELKTDNNEESVTVTFHKGPALSIAHLRVCWQPPNFQQFCPSLNRYALGEFLEATYPVAAGDLNYWSWIRHGNTWRDLLDTPEQRNRFKQWLNRLYQQRVAQSGGVIPFDQLVAWLPPEATSESGLSDPLWLGGEGRVAFMLDYSVSDPLWSMRTLAHEIGHNFGLRHPNLTDSCGAADPGSDWASAGHANSTIQEHGFQPTIGDMKVGFPQTDRRVRYDLMSYCGPGWRFWISPFHYKRLMNGGFRPQRGLVPVSLTEEARAKLLDSPRQEAPRPLWLIDGMVMRDGVAGRLNPGFVLTSAAPASIEDPEGGYSLRFLGAAGLLAEHRFGLAFTSPEDPDAVIREALFSKMVPLPEGATKIALMMGESELDSIDVSPNAPAAQIIEPGAGTEWDAAAGPKIVRWTATDADGDDLLATLSYSADGGVMWTPLQTDLTETRYEVDPALIEGGTDVRFRLFVTDGVNTAMAESGSITVLQDPQIEVDSKIDIAEALLGDVTRGSLPVRNTGTGPLTIESSFSDNPQVRVEGSFPLQVWPGEPLALALSVRPDEPGDISANLSIVSNDADDGAVMVQLRATVTDGQTPRAKIQPNSSILRPTLVGETREAPISIANRSLVDLTVEWMVEGEGFQVLETEPQFTIGAGETAVIPVHFTPAREGEFAGRVRITTNDPDQQQVVVELEAAGVEMADMTPTIAAGGVVDAAQFQATLSPGGLGSIFGSDLAPSVAGATSTPLPTELAGVRVEVDGLPAPLIFISPNQINFQMPFEAAGSRFVQIRVVRDGVAGPSVQAQTSAFAPQVFANPASGEPIVIRQDTSLVDAAHPATDGEVFIVFLTGVGGLDNPPPSGAATPGSPLASATEETTVTIGGQPAEVFFNGLTPGFVGLAQVNIRANIPALPAAALSPQGSGALTTMPLVVTVGGVSSKPLDFPVDVPGGLPPQIDAQPVGLDFGEVALGQSAQLSVTVFNRGGSNLSVGSVVATTDEFAALAPTGPVSIGPGASQSIQVSFSPSAEGTRFGTLRISSNDPNNPQLDVPLVGRGTAEARPASLAIMPSSLDFGTVEVGQSAMRDAAVQNNGGQALSLTSVASSNPSQFVVQLLGPALPTQLEPGGAYPVRIVFQPSGAGDQTAMLSASGDSASAQATLRGSGMMVQPPASSLVVTRNVLNFGGVSFGRTNELPVVVRNDGAAAATISAVTSTDLQFVLAAPALPIEVAPGQEALLRIHFTPANTGLQQATLTVSTPGGPLPTPVALTGTGQEGPKVLFSDSFNRADAPNCAIGVADNAFGGSGSHRYSAVAGGVRLRGGQLENAARDFGGVAFSTEQAACPGAATTTGQDLNIRATVFVPRDGDRSTQAGPFFHAPKLGSGAQLHGGGQAGHWVQVDSSGTIYAIRLDTGQVVATSHAVPGFDPTVPHVIEAAVRGATAEVAIDGRLRLFDQGAGTGRSSISLVPTGNLGAGAAGVGFSAYDGPGSVGGQTMDDVVVTEHESLAGLPVAR